MTATITTNTMATFSFTFAPRSDCRLHTVEKAAQQEDHLACRHRGRWNHFRDTGTKEIFEAPALADMQAPSRPSQPIPWPHSTSRPLHNQMMVAEPRMVRCWSCDLKRHALPLRRVCTSACVGDESGGPLPLCWTPSASLPCCWTLSTALLDALYRAAGRSLPRCWTLSTALLDALYRAAGRSLPRCWTLPTALLDALYSAAERRRLREE
jgi:hypothetical protein